MCNACKRAELRERPVIIINNNYIDNYGNIRERRFGRLPFLQNGQWYGDGYGCECPCNNPYSYQGYINQMLSNILNKLKYIVSLLRNFRRGQQSQCQCDPRTQIKVIPHKKPCAGAKTPCPAETPAVIPADKPVGRDKQIADLEAKLKDCNLKAEEKKAIEEQLKELKSQKRAEKIINNASPSNPIKDLKPEDASAYNLDDPTSTANIWAQNDETQKADNAEADSSKQTASTQATQPEEEYTHEQMEADQHKLADEAADAAAKANDDAASKAGQVVQKAKTEASIDDRIAVLVDKQVTGEMTPEEYLELDNLYAQKNANPKVSQTPQIANTEASIDDRIAVLVDKQVIGEMTPEEYLELDNLYAQKNANSKVSQTPQIAKTEASIDDRIAVLVDKQVTGEMTPEEYLELDNLYAQKNANSKVSQTVQTANTESVKTTSTPNTSTVQVTDDHDWRDEKGKAIDALMSAAPSTTKIQEVTQAVADSANGNTGIDKKEWNC